MASLVELGQARERRFELGEHASIGSDPANTVCLADPMVSAHHAHLERRGAAFVLRDLDSRRGTYVGKARVREVALAHGDEICIGPFRLRFEDRPPLVAPPAPRAEAATSASPVDFLPAARLADPAELARDYEKLRAALALSHSIGVESDKVRLQERILGTVIELLGADRGAIALMQGGKLAAPLAMKRSGERFELVLSQTIVEQVLRTRAGLLSADSGLDQRLRRSESIHVQGIRSVLCVPMLYQEELLGIVHVDTLAAVNAFSPRDLETLQAVASQAALAVKNVLLIEAERASAEERAHQQRLQLIGELAGGVAHDFNNLLAVILNYLGFVEDAVRGGPVAEDLKQIRHAATRASELTRQLLAFGRREELKLRPLPVAEVLGNVERLLGRSLGAQYHLSVTSSARREVVADLSQLELALMNLAVNARDAMPDGGSIRLGAHDLVLGELEAAERGLRPGPFVVIEVMDGGVGMSPEVLARIFEPFFTTKPRGKGTGLGLPTVRGVVERAHGRVEVDSAPGRGTCFRIILPAGEVLAGEAAVRARGSETVLLAEDDPGMRELAQRILEDAGYRVLSAADGAEAGVLAGEQSVDLLISDLVLPRSSGKALAELCRRQHPAVKVLFISGYYDDSSIPPFVRDSGATFLPKPFTRGDLLEAVRRRLAGARS